MWIPHVEPFSDAACGMLVRIDERDEALRFADVLRLWQQNASFRAFFLTLLAEVPFAAFRWESPPITESSVSRPFEFVVLDSPELSVRPSAQAFAEQFAAVDGRADVISFANRGGDATLVVPRAIAPDNAYSHLAAFVRGAPPAQQHALWQKVGQLVEEQLAPEPLWLNTAGAGVPWLHVRIDSQPKYYRYLPYRDPA